MHRPFPRSAMRPSPALRPADRRPAEADARPRYLRRRHVREPAGTHPAWAQNARCEPPWRSSRPGRRMPRRIAAYRRSHRPAKNVESYRLVRRLSKNVRKNKEERGEDARARVDVPLPQGAARAAGYPVRDCGAGHRRSAAGRRVARSHRMPAGRGEGARRRVALHRGARHRLRPGRGCRRHGHQQARRPFRRRRATGGAVGSHDRVSHGHCAGGCCEQALPIAAGRRAEHVSHAVADGDRTVLAPRTALRLRGSRQVGGARHRAVRADRKRRSDRVDRLAADRADRPAARRRRRRAGFGCAIAPITLARYRSAGSGGPHRA